MFGNSSRKTFAGFSVLSNNSIRIGKAFIDGLSPKLNPRNSEQPIFSKKTENFEKIEKNLKKPKLFGIEDGVRFNLSSPFFRLRFLPKKA